MVVICCDVVPNWKSCTSAVLIYYAEITQDDFVCLLSVYLVFSLLAGTPWSKPMPMVALMALMLMASLIVGACLVMASDKKMGDG